MPIGPFIRTPLTDLTGGLCNHQYFGHCAELEMRVINCFEAYGSDRAVSKCADIVDDFKECFTREKQNSRSLEMRKERIRQYYNGERDVLFAPGPRVDSFEE